MADIVGSIGIISWFLALTLLGLLCAILICRDDLRLNDEEKRRLKFFNATIVVGIVFFAALAVFTPSKKTMYVIAGAKAVEELSNSKFGEDAASVFADLKTILHNYAIEK